MEKKVYQMTTEPEDFYDDSDLYAIRNRSEQEDLKDKLKPSLLGGYAKKDVDHFIEEMKERERRMKANLEQQVKDLLIERSNLNHECRLLKSQLSETEKIGADFEKVQERLQQYMKEKTDLQAILDKTQQDYQVLQRSMEEITEKYNRSCEQMQNVESDEIRTLKKRLEELKTYCAGLEQHVAGTKKEKKSLQDEVQRLNEELAQRGGDNSELSSLQSSFQSLQSKYASLEKSFQEKSLALESAQKEFSRLENEVTQKEEQLRQMEDRYAKEVERAKRHFRLWVHKMQKQRQQILSLQKEVDNGITARATLEQLQKEYSDLHNDYLRLKDLVSVLENQKEDMQVVLSKYQHQEQENISLKRRNACLCQEIRNVHHSVQYILDQMDRQAKAAKSLLERSKGEKEQLNILMREKTDLQVKNVKLLAQLSAGNDRIQRLEEENAQLSQQLKAYQEEINVPEKLNKDFSGAVSSHKFEDSGDDQGETVSSGQKNILFPFEEAQQKAKKLAEWTYMESGQEN